MHVFDVLFQFDLTDVTKSASLTLVWHLSVVCFLMKRETAFFGVNFLTFLAGE